ncbi:MAG: AAA family ATPase [Melioribacteraceae bacterium]|nr:AAA family ATPase [Melioribacteraceae bacterium]
MMSEFEKELNEHGLTLGQIKVGESPRPEILAVIDDEPVMVQQLDEFVKKEKITEEEAKKIIENYGEYQQALQSLFKKSLKLSQELQNAVAKIEANEVEHLIDAAIEQLKSDYKYESVNNYLDSVKQNIFENLEVFKGMKPAQVQSEEGYIIDYLKDYEVNIVLDNSNKKECPVFIETFPTYNNLFGTIEKYSDGRGGWYADFTKIKGGSLLRANGGYIVINALDAFTEPGVWKALKRVLLYGKLEIQDLQNLYQFSPSVLKPEPIEIKTKVILVGNNYIFSVLSSYEDDFQQNLQSKSRIRL